MSAGRPMEPIAALGRMITVAVAVGALCAAVVAGFVLALDRMTAWTPALLPRLPGLLPAVGALLCGIFILRRVPGAGGEGIPIYLVAVGKRSGRFSTAATMLKIPATLLTLGFHGSGGIVGPLARICAGLGALAGGFLSRGAGRAETVRTAAICGAAGAVSSIFHSPLGGGIFAVEILQKESMNYVDLFPSIISGTSAFVTSRFLLGQDPVFALAAPPSGPDLAAIAWLPAVAVAAGASGLLFILAFGRISGMLYRIPVRQPLIAAAGGLITGMIGLYGASWLLGTSMQLYRALATGGVHDLPGMSPPGRMLSAMLLLVVLGKISATAFTVGAGLSGGFTGPLVIIGMTVGACIASLAGIPAASPAYFSFLAAGLAAILGGAMNIPIAAAVITVSLFGTSYAVPAAVGSILSFVLFRSRTVYEYSILHLHPRTEDGR